MRYGGSDRDRDRVVDKLDRDREFDRDRDFDRDRERERDGDRELGNPRFGSPRLKLASASRGRGSEIASRRRWSSRVRWRTIRPMAASTITRTGKRRVRGSAKPFLFIALQCDRPLEPGARFCIADAPVRAL